MGEGSRPQNGAGCTHAQLLGVQRPFALPSPESQLLENAGVREELWPPAYGGGGKLTRALWFGPFGLTSRGSCAAAHSGACKDAGAYVGLVLGFYLCLFSSPKTSDHYPQLSRTRPLLCLLFFSSYC